MTNEGCRPSINVDFDRATKNKVKGFYRSQLDSKVKKSDEVIAAYKHQLKSDKTLTAKQKALIRNRMSAQISRTRKEVEVANYEDKIADYKQKIEALVDMLNEQICSNCRQSCQDRLPTSFVELHGLEGSPKREIEYDCDISFVS